MIRHGAVLICVGALIGCSNADEIAQFQKEKADLQAELQTAEARADRAHLQILAAQARADRFDEMLGKQQRELASLKTDLQQARGQAAEFKDLADRSRELLAYERRVETQRKQLFARTLGSLSPGEQREFTVLRAKAKAHTLSFEEYARLVTLLGGPMAAYIAPGLDDVRKDVVRRTARQNPGRASELRSLFPDAFAEISMSDTSVELALPALPAAANMSAQQQ